MSEKPSSRIRCVGPWPTCKHVAGHCTACPDYQDAIAAWNRRTPAPEGEACPHDAYETDTADQPVRCVDCGMAIASAASPVVPAPEGEVVDRVMAVLNYWFDGLGRVDRNSEMVAQLAALASPVVPAPEGEVVCSGCEGRPVFPNVPCAVCGASPVVPVGVRERVLDELDKAWLHGQRRTSWRRDEAADAIIAALRPTDTGWRDIATAPKDGTEFQGWTGQWEPRCRFNPETEAFETWGRVDYDENGWEVSDVATHWMPLPPAPTDTGREA